MTQRIKADVEGHLAQAHVVLNGLIHEQPDASAVLRARQLIESPALFEQTAFAMTRMTPDVPRMYVGSARGEFLGVETFTQDASTRVRVSERKEGGEGRRLFMAESPGDRRMACLRKRAAMTPATGPGTRPRWQTRAGRSRRYRSWPLTGNCA